MLIPLLCIRPLRLVLPSAKLRRGRIVVTKATQLPSGALIWAYERGRRFIAPNRSLSASRGGLAQSIARLSSALNQSTPLAPTTSTKQRSQQTMCSASLTSASGSAENSADLTALIHRLSSQVEDLTPMVAGQQKDRVPCAFCPSLSRHTFPTCKMKRSRLGKV